ncbi:MAG: hypothetical protein JWP12_3276 [Bacteroidetes bacterium]|nr:hypothetical protein [Bacteroidota bacterium]
MATSNFYPAVSELIPIENIPSSLGPVKDGIQNIFNKIFYKDLIVEKSSLGEQGYYKLTLLSYGRIGFDIPGTGLSILLNPDDTYTLSGITPIPISLSYKWEIIKYIREFENAFFNADAAAFYNLFLEILNIDNSELIEEVINLFISDSDPILKFVTDFNTKYSPAISIAITSNPNVNVYEDLINQIESQSFDTISILFSDYINTFNSFNEIFENIKLLFKKWLGSFDVEDFKKMLIPQAAVSIENLSMGIEFPRNVFVPVATSTFNPTSVPLGDPVPEPYQTLLKFNIGSLAFSTEEGYEFTGESSFDFQKSFILGTRFTLELHDMKLDLSRTKNIPEADADGRPDDFIGVYIKDGTIGFPADWNHNPPDSAPSTGELYVSNLLAGTGGISGTIGLRAFTSGDPSPFISVRFGDKFAISLDTFSITFQQNAIISSDIQGTLTIPGVHDGTNPDYKIRIKVHIDGNGDFYVTASDEDGIMLPLHFQSYFTVTLKSLTIGRKSNKFFLALSGILDFLPTGDSFISNLLPKDIEIQKLLIWENGQIELEGGTIELRNPVKINIGPVKLTVTAIGMGSYERMHGGSMRKYKYVEFSAGISINPGGVDARGDGIQIYFSVDGGAIDIFVRIQSISIDLIIPGNASKEQATLLLSGYLSMRPPTNPDSDAGTEYAGGIDFKLPKLKMGGSAAMKYNPKIPSFLIDVSLELSTPIVLGATGMGIYGFRALFGKQYVVSKTEAPVSLPADAEWWQYYKKKVTPDYKEGIQNSKMANLPGFSFGAGVSLATAADGGKTFSSKLFFLLSLPEVFLLQGQAQILKERIGLSDETDPPFFAIIAIDPNSISAGLGVNYKFPDTGKIATVDALIEMAYFWHDSSAWYLNIGRDQPADRRVRARIFDLFDVYSYFMLSATGIRAGAGASLEKNYKVGPIKARLYAYMDTAARLAFKPIQIGGSIDIGGGVDIKVCGKGFSLTADASLAAEAPKPFIVSGSVEVCVKILKKNYCIDLDFTWTFEHTLDFSEIPIVSTNVLGGGSTPSVSTNLQSAVKSLNVMSQETLNVLCLENVAGAIPAFTPGSGVWTNIDDYILPMDSFIDIEFRKPVRPNGPDASLARFGGVTPGANYSVYVAPQRGKSNRVRHDFLLNKVEIFSWNPTTSAWVPYHVYNAIDMLTAPPFSVSTTVLNDLKFGFWQIDNPGNYTKLRLLAQTPLSFLNQGTGDTIAEELGVTNAIFCPPDAIEKTCVNMNALSAGTVAVAGTTIPAGEILQQKGVLFRVTTHDSSVIYKPYAGIINALQFKAADTLEIYLPEAMPEVTMLFKTLTSALIFNYYSRTQVGLNPSGDPVYGYTLVGTVTKTPSQLALGVLYSDPANPIDKIEVTGDVCTLTSGLSCDTSISEQITDILTFLNAIIVNTQIYDTIILPSSIYAELVAPMIFGPVPLPSDFTYQPTHTTTLLNSIFTSAITGFNCGVSFSTTGGTTIDWTTVIRFQNPRPNPAISPVNGINYAFLVDVVLNTGSVVTLSASSRCMPSYYCYKECFNFFYQICYINVVDYQYNQSLPTTTDVTDSNTSMVNAINQTITPVWRPDTTFAVRVNFSDAIFEESSSHSSPAYGFVLAFRTKGPVGHFHEYPTGDGTSNVLPAYTDLVNKDEQDQYKLSVLKYYIDYKKSYPNADGSILNSKPLYYQNPKLSLFYIFPHVYQFYQNWGSYNGAPAVDSSLEVIIKDPIEVPMVVNPADPTGPLIPSVIDGSLNEWHTSAHPTITPDIAALNNMITNGVAESNPCVPSMTAMTPQGTYNVVSPDPLEPLKLYTAIYNASYNPASLGLTAPQKREVHRYGFQTSRYKDFNEHISSYILLRDPVTTLPTKLAVYALNKAFGPTVLTRAQDVIAGTLPATDVLHQEAALDFDKLVDRLFEFKELEPAEFVQFNLVIDTGSSNVLGILIRNPEPFNDPKIPIAELNDALVMLVDTGSGFGGSYTTYYSKDRASAFITNSDHSMNVPKAMHQFTFLYKLYDGYAYVVNATEIVTLDFSGVS